MSGGPSLYPKTRYEGMVLFLGGAIFVAFAVSGYLSNATLGNKEYYSIYDVSRRVVEWSLWLFPNSLFPILDAVIGNTFVAYLFLGTVTYCAFVWIGRHLSCDRSGTRVLKATAVYIAISALTYFLSAYLFLKFYYMQPSPFKLLG